MYTITYRRVPGPFSDIPRAAVAAYIEGKAYMQIHDFEVALACWKRAISIFPKFVQAYQQRAATRIQMQRLNEAVADFEQALKLGPSLPGVYSDYAILLSTSGNADIQNTDKAVALIEKACELSQQKNYVYHANAAIVYAAHGDRQQALTNLSLAQELAPKDAPISWTNIREAIKPVKGGDKTATSQSSAPATSN